MATIFDKRKEVQENQSLMIMTMEKKFNPGSFGFFRLLNGRDPHISSLSIAQDHDRL